MKLQLLARVKTAMTQTACMDAVQNGVIFVNENCEKLENNESANEN